MNLGTFLTFKPDVFAFRLIGFGVMVINLERLPILDRRGFLALGDVLVRGLHPWN